MNISDQELIERYHSGSLEAQELRNFQQRLQMDAAFASDVKLHGLALQAIRIEAESRLRKRLAQKGRALDAEEVRRFKPKTVKMGIAMFLVVIAVSMAGLWFLNHETPSGQKPDPAPTETEPNLQPPAPVLVPPTVQDSVETPVVPASVSGKELFAAWFEPFRDASIEPFSRGDGELTPEETFYQLYWEARYLDAIAAFEELEPESKAKGDLRFLKANCLLALNKTTPAIQLLKSPGRTRFAAEARWLLALAYLRTGNLADAKDLLQSIAANPSAPQRTSAAKLLTILH